MRLEPLRCAPLLAHAWPVPYVPAVAEHGRIQPRPRAVMLAQQDDLEFRNPESLSAEELRELK